MANIVQAISQHPRPGELADWWARQEPKAWRSPLEPEEVDYVAFFMSKAAPEGVRITQRAVDPNHLSSAEAKTAADKFGSGENAKTDFARWEFRRRIISHYVFTHPLMIAYQMSLYRLTRDLNPAHMIVERIYQLITGKEMFTGLPISRIHAAVDLAIPVVVGRIFRFAISSNAAEVRLPPGKLTDPLYDLPRRGGMKLNGRWYTEHALERMAPDIPAVRAELTARAVERTRALGLKPGTDVYDQVLNYHLQKVDPRGVPPAVVEAEIMNPGSTNVTVITAKQGKIVVTVIIKKRK